VRSGAPSVRDANIRTSAVNILALDRDLARYGPETRPIRELLRRAVAFRVENTWPENGASKPRKMGQ
jgi:hypothetical protein